MCTRRPMLSRASKDRNRLFTDGFEAGATGLEPATSGVTGDMFFSPLVAVSRFLGGFRQFHLRECRAELPLFAGAGLQVGSKTVVRSGFSVAAS